MKYLILLSLLFSASVFGANGSGNVSTVLQLGLQPTVNIPPAALVSGSSPQYFTVNAQNGSGTPPGGTYFPFFKNGVLYQVTAGKSAYCFNLGGYLLGASATYAAFQFVSATSTFASNAGSISGGVYQTGSANNYTWWLYSNTAPATSPTSTGFGINSLPGTYTFGASTWPGVQAGNGYQFAVQMQCFEQ